jgi:hypothetical protein
MTRRKVTPVVRRTPRPIRDRSSMDRQNISCINAGKTTCVPTSRSIYAANFAKKSHAAGTVEVDVEGFDSWMISSKYRPDAIASAISGA